MRRSTQGCLPMFLLFALVFPAAAQDSPITSSPTPAQGAAVPPAAAASTPDLFGEVIHHGVDPEHQAPLPAPAQEGTAVPPAAAASSSTPNSFEDVIDRVVEREHQLLAPNSQLASDGGNLFTES